MTHDPMCPLLSTACIDGPTHVLILEAAPKYYLCDSCQRECQCNLIARVRADERNTVVETILEDVSPYGPEFDRARDDRTTAWLIMDEVIAAIRGVQP